MNPKSILDPVEQLYDNIQKNEDFNELISQFSTAYWIPVKALNINLNVASPETAVKVLFELLNKFYMNSHNPLPESKIISFINNVYFLVIIKKILATNGFSTDKIKYNNNILTIASTNIDIYSIATTSLKIGIELDLAVTTNGVSINPNSDRSIVLYIIKDGFSNINDKITFKIRTKNLSHTYEAEVYPDEITIDSVNKWFEEFFKM